MKEKISTEDDLLTMFSRDARKIPLLGRDEELTLVRLAKAGDRAAADRLIVANLRFVFKVAFQYWRPGLSLMDLISAGNYGLLIGFRAYDPERGVRFINYVGYWVTSQIRLAIKAHNRHCLCSLDEPAYQDDNDTTIKEVLPDDSALPDEAVCERQVQRMLSCLTARERQVVVLRFWNDITTDEIGKLLGVSGGRVKQIMARSLSKMRWANRGTFGADRGTVLPYAGRATAPS